MCRLLWTIRHVAESLPTATTLQLRCCRLFEICWSERRLPDDRTKRTLDRLGRWRFAIICSGWKLVC
jgi:hypothetical protein